MLAIDDSKLCDIGSTNESGFYHANQEGFDCITYCPYPGNVSEAIQQAHKYDLGIVAVTLMSNPEFQNVKNTLYGEDLFFRALSKQSIELGADGIVIGAPSPSNHITEDEISELSKFMSNNVVLVPGIGSQGGNAESIIRIFQRNAILNVGRDIIYDPSPSERAEFYKNSFNEVLV
jgi:orotidine-5'-phosphate decarboxylase